MEKLRFLTHLILVFLSADNHPVKYEQPVYVIFKEVYVFS